MKKDPFALALEQQIIEDIQEGKLARPLRQLHDMAVAWRAYHPQSKRGMNNRDWWFRLPKKNGKVFSDELTDESARLVASIQFVQSYMLDNPAIDYNQTAFTIACNIIVTITNCYPNKRLAIADSGLRELIAAHRHEQDNVPKPPNPPVTPKRATLEDKPADPEKFLPMLVKLVGDYGHQAKQPLVSALASELERGHYAVALPIIMEMAVSLIAHDSSWTYVFDPKLIKKWRDELVYRDKEDKRLYYKDKESAQKDRRILLVRDWLSKHGILHKTGFQIAAFVAVTHAEEWRRMRLEQMAEAHAYVGYYSRSNKDIRKPKSIPWDPEEAMFKHVPYDKRVSGDYQLTLRPGGEVARHILRETREGHYTNAFRLLGPIAAHLVECQSQGIHILPEKTSSGMTTLNQDYGSKAIYHPTKTLTKERPDIMRAINFGITHANLWEYMAPEAKAVAVNILAQLIIRPSLCVSHLMIAADHYLKRIGVPNETDWINARLPVRPYTPALQGAGMKLAS